MSTPGIGAGRGAASALKAYVFPLPCYTRQPRCGAAISGLARGAEGPSNRPPAPPPETGRATVGARSEEHTSELQSLMRISYAVFCLKKKNKKHRMYKHQNTILHPKT